MEDVPNSETTNPQIFYPPHYCVFKEDSSTTKLRVEKQQIGFSLKGCLTTLLKLEDVFKSISFFQESDF